MGAFSRPARRSLAAGAIVAGLAAGGLAGCGSLTGNSGVCGYTQAVNQMVVTRVAPGPYRYLRFTFLAKVAVTNVREAGMVATAVCALPAMPSGPMSCGTSTFGGSYRLDFTAEGNRLPPVWMTSDCTRVTGAGGARWTAQTPGFWQVLGKAMGLPHPDGNTFWMPASD